MDLKAFEALCSAGEKLKVDSAVVSRCAKHVKQAETWRHPEPPGADTHACLEMLRDSLQDRFEALHDEFSIRNSTLASVQRARIENHFNRRREIDERRIATMIERGRTENMIKLVQRQMDNDTELAAKRTRDLERKSEINCNFQEVAAGIIHIEKP